MTVRYESGGDPDLPAIDPGLQYLVEYLFEAGPTSAAGGGHMVLTWADLQAWQTALGVSLLPWQLRLLRVMSAEYLVESRTADEHDAPPPWEREVDREKVAKHIRNVLRGG